MSIMIYGQDALISQIDATTLDTFPRSVIFEGLPGSGKKLLTNYVATHLALPVIDITESLTQETIEEITESVSPSIYLIEGDKLTIREQNVILKFLEEPLKNAYIVITVTQAAFLLPTVQNRCQIYTLAPYSKEILKKFCEDTFLIDIAVTPGQLILLQNEGNTVIQDMKLLAEKIFNKISIASFPNTLSIVNKLAFKSEKDKFNIDIFCNILRYVVHNLVIADNRAFLFDAYTLTSDLCKHMAIPNVNKQYLFENFLYHLREVMRQSV